MGTQSRTKITPTNIKMQNRNISLFFFLTLLTLTIKEAQQTPINSVRHSDSVTEEGLYQNLRNQSWYAGTDIHGNAQHENNEEIWFDMHFPKEPIASNFSLHINGKPYQPSEVLDFAINVTSNYTVVSGFAIICLCATDNILTIYSNTCVSTIDSWFFCPW